MKAEYVLEFLTLADCCNFHTAAVKLGISQPALSKHIKLLEEDLGGPLFLRSTRSVELTPFGTLFLVQARRYAQIQSETNQTVLQWRNRYNRKLIIGTIPAAVEYGITDCIAEFMKQNPDCSLELLDASVSQLKVMLRYRKCDFAFIPSAQKKDTEFYSFTVAEDEHAVLLPVNHPLAKQRKVNVAQLQHENVHCLPPEMQSYGLYKEACRQSGITAELEIAGAGTRLLVGIVEKKHGVSILTRQQARKCKTPNIAVVDLEAPMHIFINLLYPKDTERSIIADRFLEFVQGYYG